MKIKSLLLALILTLGSIVSANAFWNDWDRGWRGGPWGGGPWGSYGYDWNPYDVWDPRYWAEEFENVFDDDWWGNNYYSRPYGGYGYGYPYQGGYGYGYPYQGGYSPYQYPYRYNRDDKNNKKDVDKPRYNPYVMPYYPPRPWY